MFKNRCLILLVIFSIWFSSTGFQKPSQNFNNQPTSAAAAASFGKSYPADGATDVPGTSLTLQWSALTGYSGAVTYRYCLQTRAKCPGGRWIRAGMNPSVTVKNLTPKTKYYWWVRAYDSQNRLIASADEGIPWSFTTMDIPGSFDKSSPGDLSTGISPNNLQLSWGTSSNADFYEYCLDTTNNAACDTSWIKVASVTSVVIPALSNNAVYYWQVRAVNGGGSRLANGGAWWQFTTQVLPNVFSKLSPSNNATGVPASGLMLSWEISLNATGYEYCLSLANTLCADADWKNAGNVTSFAVGILQFNTVYYWQVRAVNNSGNVLADGGSMWKFTTEVPPPDGFSKLSPKNGVSNQPVDLDLTWQTSNGATYYEYCLMNTTPLPEPSPYDGCDSPWVRVDSNPASLLDLDYATTYYWQIRAVNGTGSTEANSGGWWSFTTQAYIANLYLPMVLR